MPKVFFTEPFIRTMATLGVTCFAVAGGSTAAPALATTAVAAGSVLSATALATFFKDRPACQKALTAAIKAIPRELELSGEADGKAVRAAQKALKGALETEGLFAGSNLKAAFAKDADSVRALTAMLVEAVAKKDATFAEAGLRRDLAQAVFRKAFAVARDMCEQFQASATLAVVEITLGEIREGFADTRKGLDEASHQRAALKGEIQAMRALIERLAKGDTAVDDPAFARLKAGLEREMGRLDIAQQDRATWLADWVESVLAELVSVARGSNEGAEFDVLRLRATKLLTMMGDASAPFMEAYEAEEQRDAERHAESLRKRRRLLEEAATFDRLGLRFADAAGKLRRLAALEHPGDETAQLDWLIERASRDAEEGLRLGDRLLGRLAIESYRLALVVHTEADTPDWANLQNLLSVALANVGRLEGGSGLVAEAVAACEAALRVYTEADQPANWAKTQNNLGVALSTLGERAGGWAGVKPLDDAIAAYRAALRVYTETDRPVQWSMTQNNLGNALSTLGKRVGGEAGLKALKDAIAAYEVAMRVRNEADMPAQWAMTQNNLGNVLHALGQRDVGEAGITAISKGVAAFHAAQRFYTETHMPALWATTQYNLGNALQALGVRAGGEVDIKALNDAVAAYKAALRVRTELGAPGQWAFTTENLALAEETISMITGKSEPLRTAVGRMDAVIAVFRAMQAPFYVDKAERNLARAEALLTELETRQPDLSR